MNENNKDNNYTKIGWAYIDKHYITEGFKDYKSEEKFSCFLDNTDMHREDIVHYKECGELAPIAKGGYGKMPSLYVMEDYSRYIQEYGYSDEEHRLMVYMGAHICTFLSHGKGVKSLNITRNTGLDIPYLVDLVEKIGYLYGIEIIRDYNHKQRRRLFYFNINKNTIKERENVMFLNCEMKGEMHGGSGYDFSNQLEQEELFG